MKQLWLRRENLLVNQDDHTLEKVNKEVCVGGSFLVIVKEAPEEDSHHQGEAEKRVELKVAEVLYYKNNNTSSKPVNCSWEKPAAVQKALRHISEENKYFELFL